MHFLVLQTEVLKEDRTVNWPDMAPLPGLDRRIGMSEYNEGYLGRSLPHNQPLYPRINTTKVKVPVRSQVANRVNVSLGSDDKSFLSETRRSFTAPTGNDQVLGEMLTRASGIMEDMLKKTRNSNIFRRGDYNDTCQ